jgi:trk system potassium uptake protein TrkA
MKMRIVIIGGFRKAKFLATSLIKKGHNVTVINSNRERCDELAEIEKLHVFYGDGSRPFVLEDANVYGADIAIALSKSDPANLVICELCKKRFDVRKTVALVSDPSKTEFFYKMGVDSVVSAITTISGIIEHQALADEIQTLVPVGEGKIKISQFAIPEDAICIGRSLSEIALPKDVVIGCILRGNKSVIPRGDTVILPEDQLIIIASDEHRDAARKILTKKDIAPAF